MNLHLRIWAGSRETKTVEIDVDDFNYGNPEHEHTVGKLYLVGLDSGNIGWCYGEHGGVMPDVYLALNDAVAEIESVHPDSTMVTEFPAPIRGVDNWGLWVYLGAR